MLPYPAASFLGYRLLTEYFAFPDKFLFVDLDAARRQDAGGEGGGRDAQPLHLPDRRARATSCAHPQRGDVRARLRAGGQPLPPAGRADPPHPDGAAATGWRPDARRPESIEVYSVDRVVASDAQGTRIPYSPFYGVRHGGGGEGHAFWLASRTEGTEARGGSEVWLSLTDAGLAPVDRSGATVSVDTTCLNRDLPAKLPFGGGHPTLSLVEAGGGGDRDREPDRADAHAAPRRSATGRAGG